MIFGPGFGPERSWLSLGLARGGNTSSFVVPDVMRPATLKPHGWLKIDRTSFGVVSLMARTARGRAAIRAAGWESARDPSTNAFLPQDPTVLFQVMQCVVAIVSCAIPGE